ncbi:hypothetical protein DCAR_0314337 [Daucus carota subsp. sativus]|uniref:F-box associated beta-propeller type 3 domain-containing protein n=1 Tax=Daucus carota subsp. sativus TaxID=79200 RepID=A0A162AP73_DAUCS|nr:hypothetical protein DCAR_0314337 [Daucus carota subsp. sativus]
MHENIHAVKNGGLIIRQFGKLYLADYESLHDDVSTNPIEIVDPVIKSDAKLEVHNAAREPYGMRPTFCHKYFGLCIGGFGYDHVSDDYKFVKLGMCGNRFAEIIVTVYSVRTNSWTHIQNARLSRDIYLNDQWGRFAGGALYWKAIDFGKKTEIIVGFDLGLGQFREVAWPADRNFWNLYGFGDNLYTLKYSKSPVDVFQMNDYSAEKPWSKAFTVMGKNVFDYGFKPLMYSEGLGEVLILVDNKRPVWYHLESKRIKEVRINPIPRLTSDAEFYTESLFQFPKDRQPQNLLRGIRGTKQQQNKRETTAQVANSRGKNS